MCRLFIKTKDLADIIEVSERTAKSRLAYVRAKYGIPKYEPVSIEKYSRCFELNEEQVIKAVEDSRNKKIKHLLK
ncbi:hypothetical protein [Pedobacter frigoris]|uniref:hypothetical protein n=1 Tax=Pedobacter frigoris TaxID=2571272 RepID=UPI00292CBD98|nr:hypothetical protein [Pedobacter frigoris]